VLRSQAVQLGRSSRERGTGTGQCEERQVEKLKTTAGKIIYLCTPGPRPQEEAGQAARGSRRGTNRPKLETRLGEVKRTRPGPGKPPLSTGTRTTGEAVDWSVVEHQAEARRCPAC
jgi:hypothetical protein